MNATVPANLRIVGANLHTTTVSPYGFSMAVEYEYDPGESPIFWPTESAHPGSPQSVQLLACKVNGIDIVDMLSFDQTERIESAILSQLEP